MKFAGRTVSCRDGVATCRVGRGPAGVRLQPAEVHGEGREQADGAAVRWTSSSALAQHCSS